MSPAAETSIEVGGTGFLIDERARTDLEFYKKVHQYQVRPRNAASTVPQQLELSESSTVQQERGKELERRIQAIFRESLEEDFEDGMESKFSRDLLSLVRRHGNAAMSEISYLIIYERVNSEVSYVALCWLGRMDDPLTYSYRLWLLEKALASASARVRDGAALGLASMGDPNAIPYISDAVRRENCVELREDLKQVLEELESVNRATFPKKDTEGQMA